MDEVPLKTYRRRWWILIIYSLLAAVQNIYWLTYNTTAILTQEFYQTSEIAVTMISMIGPICYFVFALLSAWVLDYLALRKSIVIASAMMMFCSFLRIAAYNPQTFWIIFVAQVFNASAAPGTDIIGIQHPFPYCGVASFLNSNKGRANARFAKSDGSEAFAKLLSTYKPIVHIDNSVIHATILVVATKDIHIGEELFIDYPCYPTDPNEQHGG